MRRFFAVLASLLVISLSWSAQAGGEKDKQKKNENKGTLLVVPAPGAKEMKLSDWRFTQGTRHFSVNGDEKVDPKSKQPDGPEFLEFREEKSTTYKNGIFTLIPTTSLKKIAYDRDKKTVAVTVVTEGADDVTLSGATKFTGSNRITIEAEVDIGVGLASQKFHGGIEKGLVSVTFAAPKPVEKAKGAPSVVTADDKEKSKHPAFDVQPLYQADGGYRMVPFVMFKKTVKIDIDKIAGFRFVQADKKASNDYEVTLKDGNKHTLTLLTTIEHDEKKMTLVGLVGRVPAGYKLFSLDAIYEYRAGEDEKK